MFFLMFYDWFKGWVFILQISFDVAGVGSNASPVPLDIGGWSCGYGGIYCGIGGPGGDSDGLACCSGCCSGGPGCACKLFLMVV